MDETVYIQKMTKKSELNLEASILSDIYKMNVRN